jgi:hypothetical protein
MYHVLYQVVIHSGTFNSGLSQICEQLCYEKLHNTLSKLQSVLIAYCLRQGMDEAGMYQEDLVN